MDYVTIKVTREARRLLRLIAAQTGEQMSHEAERIFASEAERLGVRSAVRSDTPGAAENVPKARKSAKK